MSSVARVPTIWAMKSAGYVTVWWARQFSWFLHSIAAAKLPTLLQLLLEQQPSSVYGGYWTHDKPSKYKLCKQGMRDATEKPVFPHRLSSVVQARQRHIRDWAWTPSPELSGNTPNHGEWGTLYWAFSDHLILSLQTLEGEQGQCNLPTKWRTWGLSYSKFCAAFLYSCYSTVLKLWLQYDLK